MLTVAPGVHHASSPEGTAILDTRTGQWLMLDADASRIWQALTARGTLDGLAEEIALPTGTDPDSIQHQISVFLDNFTARGLLLRADQPHRKRRRWRR